MDSAIWTAIISGVVTLIVSIGTWVVTAKKDQAQTEKLFNDKIADLKEDNAQLNAIVQQQVALIRQDGDGAPAAGHQGVQVVGGIIGKRQYAALHIENDETAMFSQFKRVFDPVPVMDIAFVCFKPGF